MKNVEVSTHNHVTTITINRKDVKNAVDKTTAFELSQSFRQFDRDDNQYVAILTGSGDTFCSGADLKNFSRGKGNRVELDGDGPMGPTRLFLSKPVIAAVEGFAVAGGLELAIWCDLRVAARDAVFGVFCRRWGVPLIDGGTIRLSRLIGHSRALDMILTGRAVSGEEAEKMGLVNRLVEPGLALEKARELAEQLCRFPQKCMRSDRISSYMQWDLTLDEAVLMETSMGLKVIETGEAAGGARRFSSGSGRHGSFEQIDDSDS